jgi:protein TonB
MKLYKLLAYFFLLQSANLPAQVISNAGDSASSDGKNFTEVEREANFIGGEAGWRNFLIKNLNPNVPVDNDAPAGKYTVVVKFVVSADGSLSNIAAETNMGYGMEKEVIRLIQKSGKWAPAIKDGKPINAYRRQPVTF